MVGMGRAFGGAVFFSLPLLMTMEMWYLGVYMDRFRLALMMILMIPLLIGLDRYAGFERTDTWAEDVADGIIAYGVGIISSILVLLLFNVLEFGMPLREWTGKVALQSVPASFGAVLATSQLGGGDGGGGGSGDGSGSESGNGSGAEGQGEERQQPSGYWAALLFMAAGALFLAFNVAPTEEMVLIAYMMTPWHALALVAVSLLLMHAFVYAVEFHGTPSRPEHLSPSMLFLRFTVVGYAIALLVSAYVLWTFGRYESGTLAIYITDAVVLGFPASLGAAAARLVI